jgi:hypothetical protein
MYVGTWGSPAFCEELGPGGGSCGAISEAIADERQLAERASIDLAQGEHGWIEEHGGLDLCGFG